ncbi:MAG: right-handed parallel beta-helix repeat-containing protein [Planctomycetota bacterium]
MRMVPLALVLFASVPLAQERLWVVDDGPYAADFAQIQDAVDAASDGDAILVRPGTYFGFDVVAKGLTIFAEELGTVELPDVFSSTAIEVSNLQPGQVVVIRGIEMRRVQDDDLDTEATIALNDNLGFVLFEDCDVSSTGSITIQPAGRALRVRNSAGVAAVRCVLFGGVYSLNSEVSLYESFLVGPRGDDCSPPLVATPGRPAMEIDEGRAFLAGCTLIGGKGGDGYAFTNCCPAEGDVALRLDAGAPTVHVLDTELNGGAPGSEVDCGIPDAPPTEVVSGTVIDVPGTLGSGYVRALGVEGELLRFVQEGELGALVFVGLSTQPLPLYFPPLGLLLPNLLSAVDLPPVGPLGTGPAYTDVPVPALPAGLTGLELYTQTYLLTPAGVGTLGAPSVSVLADLRDPSTGDCDTDGTGDLWQILQGELLDDDLDGEPNLCETTTRLYVDDDAPGDPGPGNPLISDPAEDGTLQHPFDSLQEAVDASVAAPYTVVLVADGTYTGAGNRDVDFGGRELTIRSAGGPSACIIDAQNFGRAFVFESGETYRSRVSGFTIRNGLASGGGGAIRIDESDPTIENCVFLDNDTVSSVGAHFGGAIWAEDSRSLIRGCTFQNNTAKWHGGAIYFESDLSYPSGDYPDDAILEDCLFVGNSAGLDGGALGASFGTGGAVIRGCTFLDNVAAAEGGALEADAPMVVESCYFSGNEAGQEGGAIHAFGPITVSGCTIEGNQAVLGGGMHSVASSGLIDRSILWGNVATGSATGQQLSIAAFDDTLNVRYSDVQGGEAGVDVPGTSELFWEEGNFDLDPLFAGPGDPHLLPGSPCIDAADPGYVPPLLTRDLDGGPRREGATVDVGADEVSLP